MNQEESRLSRQAIDYWRKRRWLCCRLAQWQVISTIEQELNAFLASYRNQCLERRLFFAEIMQIMEEVSCAHGHLLSRTFNPVLWPAPISAKGFASSTDPCNRLINGIFAWNFIIQERARKAREGIAVEVKVAVTQMESFPKPFAVSQLVDA